MEFPRTSSDHECCKREFCSGTGYSWQGYEMSARMASWRWWRKTLELPMRSVRVTAVLLTAILLLGVAVGRAAEGTASGQPEFFENEVRPLLVTHCAKCHTGKKAEGGLSLATRASVLA